MTPTFDFINFKTELKKNTTSTLDSICQTFGKDRIAGFSLYSDGDGGSVVIAFNTVDYLQGNWKEDPEEDKVLSLVSS